MVAEMYIGCCVERLPPRTSGWRRVDLLPESLQARWALREALGPLELVRLRAVSRDVLSSAGQLMCCQHKLSDNTILSTGDGDAETAQAALKAVRLRRAAAVSRDADRTDDSAQRRGGPPDRLLQRCLGILRCTMRTLAATCTRVESFADSARKMDLPWLKKLSADLSCLDVDVAAGRVRTVAAFASRARAPFAEALLLASACASTTSAQSAQVAFAAAELERSLMLADVPEMCCARLSALPGWARIDWPIAMSAALELEVVAECEPRISNERRSHTGSFVANRAALSPHARWLWVEIRCIGLEGDSLEVDAAPPVRVDMLKGLVCEASGARRQPYPPKVIFRKRLTSGPRAPPSHIELLRALHLPGHELLVVVRADWPILQHSQVRLHSCSLRLSILCPQTLGGEIFFPCSGKWIFESSSRSAHDLETRSID